MATGLRFISHSCLLLEDGDGDLLMDPWFFGDIVNDSWSLLGPPDLDAHDFGRVRHVWISHAHPDHFHVPTLEWLRGQVEGPLTAFVRSSPNPTLRETMADLGFDVTELQAERTHHLTDDLSLTLFTGGHDSSLVIRRGDRAVLNQNDCLLDNLTLGRLKRRFPTIDAWFYQSSYGGAYATANADDPDRIVAVRQRFLDQIAHSHARLRPSTFVPFAGFMRYVKPENAYLNDYVVTPVDLMGRYPDLPIQLPWPGDEVRWEDWEDANRINESRLRDLFAQEIEITPRQPVDDGRVLAAGSRLVGEAPANVGPPETHVAIAETGRAALVDFRRRRFSIAEQPDPTKLACCLPGDELVYFCASPYGAIVLLGGSAHVVNTDLWLSLVAFRSSLEPGNHWGPGRVLRARLVNAERHVVGGRVRQARHRLRAGLRRLRYRS